MAIPVLPVWPADVPFEPLREDFSIPQIANPVASSEMQAGTSRRRRETTLEYEKQRLSIFMLPSELRRFRTFYWTEIANSAARFLMPVWDIDQFVERTVVLEELSSIVPMGQTERGPGYRVTMSIAIEVSPYSYG